MVPVQFNVCKKSYLFFRAWSSSVKRWKRRDKLLNLALYVHAK